MPILTYFTFLLGQVSPLSTLEEFEQHAEVTFSILTKVFIIILVSIAFVYIFRVLLNKKYSIRHVRVPKSIEDAGHSGPVIANRIQYRLHQIIQRVSATEKIKGYSTADAEGEVAVDVAGVGLPIKSFVELLGTALGIQRSRKIDIDFFFEAPKIVMLIKIGSNPAERFEAVAGESVDLTIKHLVFEAAENILKYTNDEVLQTYFGLVEQIGDKQIKLAKYRLSIYRDNPKLEINAIAALAWGMCMHKRYDEAEQIVKEGIARHKKACRIYVIWGSLLMQTGKPEEAIEKFETALKQIARGESITRISNIYSSLGNCYGKLKKTDVALQYFQKALEVDPNASRAYYNLAMLHLNNNSMDAFFESLEKALEKGFQRENILKDPKCTPLLNEPRMTKLIEKFTAEYNQ